MAEEAVSGVPLVGSRISLISKKNIRYEGVLYNINTSDASLALQNGKCYFTLYVVLRTPYFCTCVQQEALPRPATCYAVSTTRVVSVWCATGRDPSPLPYIKSCFCCVEELYCCGMCRL